MVRRAASVDHHPSRVWISVRTTSRARYQVSIDADPHLASIGVSEGYAELDAVIEELRMGGA